MKAIKARFELFLNLFRILLNVFLFVSLPTGFLADLSGSYSLTFYVAASFHMASGCILFLSNCIQHRKVITEDLNDLIPTENFLVVEKVTVL